MIPTTNEKCIPEVGNDTGGMWWTACLELFYDEMMRNYIGTDDIGGDEILCWSCSVMRW